MTEKVSHELKHYYAHLPEDILKQVQEVASIRQVSVTELLRRFTRLGLEAERSFDRGGKLIKREDGKDTELLLF
jgi:hypothetical protein